ncbi:MAG TPA: carbohydrate kinase family protein [Levilinea sp.]|nr:carbohydrate kinase family protein [Levilinea sp.]
MKIACTGSIAYDYLMTFPGYFRDHIIPDRLETISLSFLVDSMVRQRGGVAPNIAYTMALLGERPLVLGTAGSDFEEYRVWLEAKNIDTTFVRIIPDVFTASFFANTDLSNNQISSFYTGAMAYAGMVSLHDVGPERPDLVIISPNDPGAMDQYVRECGELKMPYLYDPGQQVVRSDPEELRRGVLGAHSLFLNDYEYTLIKKHTGLSEEDILNQVDYMVVTCGEHGASIYADGKVLQVPCVPPAMILDPTGVGDAFRGGFVRGFALGLDWTICGQMGSLAATYCLEQRGTQNHLYTPQEFMARFRQYFDDQGALNALLQIP